MSKVTPFTDVDFTAEQQDDFWARVQQDGDCWLWSGNKINGYGSFRFGRTSIVAHRVAYMIMVGPIPDGLQLDHLCRVRHCVNPSHLEPVTPAENQRRAAALLEACAQGHRWSEENTVHYRSGRGGRTRRQCRECTRAKARRSMAGWRARRAVKV